MPTPQTDDELRDFLSHRFGFVLPDRAVCAGHCSPFRAFADAYFARTPVSIWIASRGFGGKSYMLAMLGLIEALTLKADVTILGGSGEQSSRVHDYLSRFLHSPGAPSEALESAPTATRTRFVWGNRVTALTASQRSVRGPHPQRLRLDEVDEMQLSIFNAAMGQPMSIRGVQKQTIASSTHQYAFGTMSKVLERARVNGWGIYKWCHHETVKSAANPDGWLVPSDIESKVGEVDARMWSVEYELNEPSAEGLVYAEFSGDNITDAEPDPALPIELAVDDGYVDPRVVLFIQRTPTRILVFDEQYHSYHLGETCVNEAVARCGALYGVNPETGLPKRLAEIACGPPEAKDLQLRFRQANIAYRAMPHHITEGIKRLRRLIKDAHGVRVLQVHHRCVNTLREIREGYMYPQTTSRDNDNPVDANNHACDALRYWAWIRSRR